MGLFYPLGEVESELVKMSDARALLEEYAVNGSEAAFRELVQRYLNLVYSTALRLLDGDGSLAQDVAQTVFIDLARQAAALSPRVMLGGWLHRRTCHVAATTRRGEFRRKKRERIAMELHSLHDHDEPDLARLSPILDEAINRLAEEDRVAILLRFYEQHDFRAVGEALGTKEDAARMRVCRALNKLHRVLSRKGVTLSVTALGAALASGAITAAPTGLATGISATALAGAAAGGASLTVFQWILMSKIKTTFISTLLVGVVATPLIFQHQSLGRLREDNRNLREQLDQATQLLAEGAANSNGAAKAPGDQMLGPEQRELLKLRGQVAVLQRQLAEAARTQAKSKRSPQSPGASEEAQDPDRQQAIIRMGHAKNWMVAFFLYADKNQEQCPADFQSAASFLPNEGRDETLSATNQFEILYKGSLSGITNPASAIVLRETEAFPGPNGGWLRTYGFADGHTEIHRAEDGNFEPWEAQHLARQSQVPKPGGL